jgi:hypothetical protein
VSVGECGARELLLPLVVMVMVMGATRVHINQSSQLRRRRGLQARPHLVLQANPAAVGVNKSSPSTKTPPPPPSQQAAAVQAKVVGVTQARSLLLSRQHLIQRFRMVGVGKSAKIKEISILFLT